MQWVTHTQGRSRVQMRTKLWLALLAAYAPLAGAQADGCSAEVKANAMGLQKPLDDTRRPTRTLTLARYRVDVTASEKQCAVVTFTLKYSYTDSGGKTVTESTDAQSMYVRGGKATQQGEWPLQRELPRVTWSVDSVSCKRCP